MAARAPFETWSVGDADFNMGEQILVRLAEIVYRHPWWASRLDLMLHAMARHGVRKGDKLLDAGCGWGLNYLKLLEMGHDVTGLDISRQMLEKLAAPGRKLVLADLTRPLNTEPAQFDCATLLDVIEHVDDDKAVLKGLAWLLKPGGLMIVSAPAQPELMGEFDLIQGHRRRYTPESLRAAFDFDGIELLEVFWWGGLAERLIRRQRRRPKGAAGEPAEKVYERYLKVPAYPARLALDLVMALDRRQAKARRAKSGTSLWAIARKR